ncbi:hypothetical protein F4Y93_06085 [Candidatus Poribacteria bacterium]|nr:hypothetical protein [Candidatus Poribacteria bacterium]
MSFFKKIKRKVRHVARNVERTAEHTVRDVENTAEGAANQVADTAEQVAKTAEKEIDNVSNIAEQALKSIEGDVKHLANEAKGEVSKLAKEAKDEIRHLADEAKNEIRQCAKQVVDDLKKAVGDIEHAFEKGAFEKCIKATLHALHAYPALPTEFGMEIPGGITLAFEDTESKIAVLEHYAGSPPHGRSEIMEFVGALAPTSIQVQETIEIDLIVVSSSALEFGPYVKFGQDQVMTILTHVLDKAGVH